MVTIVIAEGIPPNNRIPKSSYQVETDSRIKVFGSFRNIGKKVNTIAMITASKKVSNEARMKKCFIRAETNARGNITSLKKWEITIEKNITMADGINHKNGIVMLMFCAQTDRNKIPQKLIIKSFLVELKILYIESRVNEKAQQCKSAMLLIYSKVLFSTRTGSLHQDSHCLI